jgi:SPP1 gp7 family putative phage head morphogenesis protein
MDLSRLKKRAATRRKRKPKGKAPSYPYGVERSHLAVLRALHSEIMAPVIAAAKRALGGRADAYEDYEYYDQVQLQADAATALNRRLASIRRSVSRLFVANDASMKAIGLPVVQSSSTLGTIADLWVSRHVQLITKMESEVISDIGVMVREGIDSGLSYREMQKDIMQRAGVGKSRAELIARTEISSANMAVNKSRFEALGVERCIWRTAKDERVREAHRKMEGVEFALNDPPHVGGGTDEKGRAIPDEGRHLPGDWYQCRCRCEPILPDNWLGD